jgi:GDSL-like Lipase/Acylhydrolase family
MRFTGVLGAFILVLVLVPVAWAGPSSKTTAAVSLGDSYISGEAGRWNGNSISPQGDKDGTDRACLPAGPTCQVDKTRVYERGTENGGCHRSDVAEIKSANLPVAERIDLSCSGGKTNNIFRASHGGTGQNGEPAQADKLVPVARAKDVKLVMLSIGGNDLAFAGIIQACLEDYEAKTGPCQPSQQKKIDSLKAKATAGVAKAIDEIRAVMSEAGYSSRDYRLIVQTYPSVVPRAAENRYPESGPERTANGCPIYDQDSNWARDSAAPQIGAVAKAAANSRGAETLDLINAFQGHEFCSKSDAQSTPFARPAAAGAEWGRFLGASTIQQGELQEAFHPDAYGQRALATCVTKAFAAAPGRFACSGTAGIDPSGLSLVRTGPVAAGSSCLARRSSLSPAGIGRLKLGLTRKQLVGSPRLATVRTSSRTSKRYRYCVKRSRGHVTAVFGKGTKVDLLIATAGSYGNRGVHPGVSLRNAKRTFRGLRRVSKTVYRFSRSSRRIIGVRKGKVRYVGVASKRTLRSKRLLRTYVKRAG